MRLLLLCTYLCSGERMVTWRVVQRENRLNALLRSIARLTEAEKQFIDEYVSTRWCLFAVGYADHEGGARAH
uniref:Putative secreted protein n=1 Tax=Anopheles triannulatus TaxID=58253 RepID=A0A2M4B4I2_9DIPT